MSNNKHRVLLVDDEADILEMLAYNLEKEGYEVATSSNGEEAVATALEFLPELILIDIMMPKVDGVEACRQLREIHGMKDTYIIFLTARTEEYSELAAFEVGADDYIAKPIKPRALLKKIDAIFRREDNKTPGTSRDVLEVGDLLIDKTSYTLHISGKETALPKKEFQLLAFLVENPHKVFSRDELLSNIWGDDVYVVSRTVDVHIRRIREKIGEEYIHTVKGVGYKFDYHGAQQPL